MEHSSSENLYPIAVFLNELKNDDAQARINAVKGLSTLAVTCGPEKTRLELLPFINDTTVDDDDVLAYVAEELGEFLPHVGGEEFSSNLLDVLEKLAIVEDTKVREKSVESMRKVIAKLSNTKVQDEVFPIIVRMAKESFFTAPSSSCCLIPAIYPRVTVESQKALRDIFCDICKVKQPILRRSAASSIQKLAECLSDQDVTSTMIPALTILMVDDQDAVRLFTIEPLISLFPRFPIDVAKDFYEKTIKSLLVDKSWRVRYALSKSFDMLMPILLRVEPKQLVFAEHFKSYLHDLEPEVRSMASQNAFQFCQALSEPERKDIILDHIFPAIQHLINDPNVFVKSSLASNIMSLSPLLGESFTLSNLVPLVLKMLKDDSSEVRMQIVVNLGPINEVIGSKKLSELIIPALIELAEDSKWRVRLAIIEFIPQIAEKLGVAFFDQRMVSICSNWMMDEVYAVREAIVRNVVKLMESFGLHWAKSGIIETIITLSKDTSYLRRLTALFAINEIAGIKNATSFIPSVLEIPLRLCQDPIPNVRFNSAKTLKLLASYIEKSELSSSVIPNLKTLSNDADEDVRFYSENALNEIAV